MLFFKRESHSIVAKIVGGLGIALTMVGVTYALSLSSMFAEMEFLSPTTFHALMLGIALAISCFGIVEADGQNGRPATGSLLVAMPCLVAGIVAVWLFPSGVSTIAQHPPNIAHHWIALLGCAALLLITWRLWGAPLAIAGWTALFYLTIGHRWPNLLPVAPNNLVQGIGQTLWFNTENGAFGWLFALLSSTVFPFFLLFHVLAGRTLWGASIGSDKTNAVLWHRKGSAMFDVDRMLTTTTLPTLLVSALIMQERLDVGFWIIVAALIASALIITFWVSVSTTMRKATHYSPQAVLQGLAETGVAFGKLLIAASVIGLVLAVIDRTGLSIDVAQILVGLAGERWLPLLIFAAIVSIGFGLTLPALAAYLIVIALIWPSLRTVGVDEFASHLLILLFCLGASVVGSLGIAPKLGTDRPAF